MSAKTTVVLLVLLAGLGVAMFTFGGDEDGPAGGSTGDAGIVRLFDDVLVAEIVRVELSDPRGGGSAVELTRKDGRWWLESPEVAGGRRVPARSEEVSTLLETFQALSAFRVAHRPEEGAELGPLGLAPELRATVTVGLGDGSRRAVQIGSDVDPGGLLVRVAGRPEVFEVDRGVRSVLLPEPGALWDRRLIRLRAVDVRSIAVSSPRAGGFRIVREFSSWRLREPLEARADHRFVDELRNRLLGLEVLEYLDPEQLPAELEEVVYEVELVPRDEEDAVTVRFGRVSTQGRGVIARVAGSADVVLVDDAVVPFLRRPARHYRDRRLCPRASEAITRLVVSVEGLRTLELARRGPFVQIVTDGGRPEEAIPILMDDELRSDFFRQLTELRVERYAAGMPDFAPELRVVVTYGGTSEEEEVERELLFGAEVPDEGVPARVTGERGAGWIDPRGLAFLRKPWWSYARRFAGGSSAWFRIAALEVEDDGGRKARFVGRPGPDGLVLVLMEDGREQKAVPRQGENNLVDRAVEKLVHNRVKGFLGERGSVPDPAARPRLTVRWLENPEGTVRRIEHQGRWRTWIVGQPDETGDYPAISDYLPELVFVVGHEDIEPFLQLLDFARPR